MTDSPIAAPRWARPLAAFAMLFGALTIYEGGGVVLREPAALAAAGSFVPFVVWFNFLAGFAYIAAGVGLWLRLSWAAPLAMAIAVATVAVFAAFGVHVALGGAYEGRTVVAMTLRAGTWIAIALVTRRRPARAA